MKEKDRGIVIVGAGSSGKAAVEALDRAMGNPGPILVTEQDRMKAEMKDIEERLLTFDTRIEVDELTEVMIRNSRGVIPPHYGKRKNFKRKRK